MKNTTHYLILLLAMLACKATAQVPGYMGNRFMLSANICPNVILPASTDFTYNDDYRITKLSVRPRYGGSVDYVLNRNSTIGLKYSFIQVGVNAPVYYTGYDWYGDPTTKWDVTARAAVKCHSIGLRFTSYASGSIPAPMGFFAGYNLGVGIAQFKDLNGDFLTPYDKKKKGTYVTTLHPDILLFLGIRRGIGKKFMWSFMSEFNFSYLGFWLGNLNYDYKHPVSDVPGSSYAGRNQYRNNRFISRSAYYNSTFFNISFEFTFLPF